jgi:hypothetical protein
MANRGGELTNHKQSDDRQAEEESDGFHRPPCFRLPFARQQVILRGVGRLTASEHDITQRITVRNQRRDATDQLIEIRMIADASGHAIRAGQSNGAESSRQAAKP